MRNPGLPLAFLFGVVLGVALLSAGLASRGQAAVPPASPPHAPAASPIPNTYGWQDELVDKLGDVGRASSLALDSSGYPHIAYYDLTAHSLKYAAWDGVAWTLDTVETGLGGIDHFSNGYQVKSAIGVFGSTTYLVYEKLDDATARRYLRYAVGGPGGWNISTLGSVDKFTYDYAPSLRLDKNHSLHVSYTQSGRQDQSGTQSIIYARLDVTGTSWVVQTVDRLPNLSFGGYGTSLALDANNNPQIAYGAERILNNAPVKWAQSSSGTWLRQTVDLTGTWPALAVDTAGKPHIAYIDDTDIASLKLKYASRFGTVWQSQSLGICQSCSSAPSLTLDVLDHPHIAADDNPMLFLQWDGVHWQIQRLTDGSVKPSDPALALDAVGNAHVSYLDVFYQDLHYMSWAPNWLTQTVAITGDEAHLAVDLHNRPYISYSTNPLPAYYHVQLANWTPGGYWQYREALPFTAGDHFMRLEYDVNHQPLPIFSYAGLDDPSHAHLGFAQWNGTNFVTQTVDSANRVGIASSLSFDNRADPVIGYLDVNGPHPHLRLAVSSNYGQTWGIYTDTAAPTLGQNSGLRAVSTGGSLFCCRIYIAYYETSGHALRLATWNSGQWTDELIDGGNGVSGFVSLAVDRTTGKPAMAYLANQDVRYAFWRGAWLTATVDSGAQGLNA